MQLYGITYISTILFCALLMLMICVRMSSDVGSEEEVRIFRILCVVGMADVLVQTLWMAGVMNPAKFPRALNWFVNAGDLIATGWCIYLIYLFISVKFARLQERQRPRWFRILLTVPVLLMTALNVSSVATHWIFSISPENTYVRGGLYWVHVVLIYFYDILTLWMMFHSLHRDSRVRKDFRVMLIFAVVPLIGGVLQIVVGSVPFTFMAMVTALIYYFIDLQSRQINTDALTGVNNRRRGEELLQSKLAHADKAPFWIFMSDVDRFKHINDTYGHITGDRALQTIGQTFLELQHEYPSFTACRHGGDEFLFCVNTRSDLTPEKVIHILRGRLAKAPRPAGMRNALTLSVGYACADAADLDLRKLIGTADAMLYEDKKRAHRASEE